MEEINNDSLQPSKPHAVSPVLLGGLAVALLILAVVFGLKNLTQKGEEVAVVTPPTPTSVDTAKPDLGPCNGKLELFNDSVSLVQGGMLGGMTVQCAGEDVTQKAEWFSEDASIALVSNTEPIKGQIQPAGKGTTTIMVEYNGLNAIAQVAVKGNELAVRCEASVSKAKVGEQVVLNAFYNPIGVPPYTYVWSGDEKLTGDQGLGFKTYTTPGVKKIHFATKDVAGSTAEADCTVTITE